MKEKIARFLSVVFHPVLVPTLGFILMFVSGFYFSIISWEAKRFILLVLFFTTGILPLLAIAVLAINPKFDISMENTRDRIMLFLFSAVFYYVGYMIMSRMKAFPVFYLFMIAGALLIIALMLISFKWRISSHMAALGGVTGTFFALSFRSGINPVWSILILIIVSGLVGTARLVLKKHNLMQVATGYILGFIVFYFVMYFI